MKGVIVTGAGRSGTSLLTRLVNLLGVPTCIQSDLLAAGRSNRTGFWESRTVTAANELLLALADGRWCCPPQPEAILQRVTPSVCASCAHAFKLVHTSSQWVVKDPRLSFTMPFWQDALGIRPVVLVVVRAPAEVASSVVRQMRLSVDQALAVWERSTRTILRHSRGLPVIVAPLHRVLERPYAWCEESWAFLSRFGFTLTSTWQDGVRDFLDKSLLHSADIDVQVSPEQSELWDFVVTLAGNHAALPSLDLPMETPSTASVFDGVRANVRAHRFPTDVVGASLGGACWVGLEAHRRIYSAIADAHAQYYESSRTGPGNEV